MFCILSPSTACRLALLSCSGEAEASGFFATLAFLLLVGADPLPYFPRFLQHGLDLVRVALDPWHVAVDDLHQSIRHVPHLVTVTKSLLVEHEVRFIVLTEHFPRLVVSSPFTGVHLSRYPSIEGLCGCRVFVAPPELQTGSFGPGRPQEDFPLLLASEAPAEMVALDDDVDDEDGDDKDGDDADADADANADGGDNDDDDKEDEEEEDKEEEEEEDEEEDRDGSDDDDDYSDANGNVNDDHDNDDDVFR
eukprot:s1318_g5.t2